METSRKLRISDKNRALSHIKIDSYFLSHASPQRMGGGSQRGLAYDEVNRRAAARRRKCTEVSVAAWLVGHVNVWQTTFAT